MPSDRRYVVIPVDDPDVTNIKWAAQKRWTTPEAGGRREILTLDHGLVPVPPDDRLAQDVEALWEWAEATYRQAIPGAHEEMLRPYVEGARRLRAAFQLDQEDGE